MVRDNCVGSVYHQRGKMTERGRVFFWNRMKVVVMAVLLPVAATAEGVQQMAAVGVLMASPTGGCTAALIAPDVVLTAAHCVEAKADTPAEMSFRTGAYPGAPRQEVGVAAVAFHPLYTLNLEPEVARLRFDLALVRLAHPIAGPRIAPLALGPAPEIGERLWLASYRASKGDRARERLCEIFPGPRELFALGCDVEGGESGSPILRKGENGLEVAAVLSSRSRVREQPIGFAPPVLPRIEQVFDILPGADQTGHRKP